MSEEPQSHYSPLTQAAKVCCGETSDKESSLPNRVGQIILLVTWIPLIRVFAIWVPYPVAAGLSALLVMLVAYRFQPKKKKSGFVGWSWRSVIFAAIISTIAYIVSRFF
jgi:hypothetical protein